MTGPPIIKQWVGGDVPRRIQPEKWNKKSPHLPDATPHAPTYEVSLKVGPMSKVSASQFEREWKRQTRSDEKVYQREQVGRTLAQDSGFKAVDI